MNKIYLQNPNDTINNSLKFFKDSFTQGDLGGGAFAFVSEQGISLLFDSVEFSDFMARGGQYTLIVGTDSITNSQAIRKLTELAGKYNQLTVYVHVSSGNTIFHPKLSWCTSATFSGCVVIGSANLTVRGLLNNWEAICNFPMTCREMCEDIRAKWQHWVDLLHASGELYHLDAAEVESATSNNSFVRTYKMKTPERNINGDELLIMEMPKGRKGKNTYSQVNFGKELFETYFNVTNDEMYRFIGVSPDVDNDELANVELRPPVVKLISTNYNFELSLPKGHYGYRNAPIGLFYKVSNKTYKYTFIAPTSILHSIFSQWLAAHVPVKGNKTRRKIIKSSVLIDESKASCGDEPLKTTALVNFCDRFFV